MSSETRSSHSSFGGLLVTGLGVAFLIYNLLSFHDQNLLRHTGTTVQAQVTRLSITRRKGGIAYNVAYVFQLAGQRFEGDGQVSVKNYNALKPGGPIEIRYAPSSPSISETAEMSHNGTSLFITTFLGFPASVFMIVAPFLKKPEKAEEEGVLDDLVGVPNVELPPLIKGIAFTAYPVTDMRRARKFYEGDLGLKVTRDFRGEWIEYHLWDNCFAITTMMGDGVKPSEDGGKIALEVNDVDEFVATLRKKGTRIKMEPFSTPGCRMAVIYDPEGNTLTLHKRTSTS